MIILTVSDLHCPWQHPVYEDEPDELPELPITVALRDAIAGQGEE